MESKLKNGLLTVCGALNRFNVQYILVGGTAVALNGHYRISLNAAGELMDKPDIDVWYSPTYDNYFNILKVMKELGYDTSEFEVEQSPNPKKSFFKMDFDEFCLDLLPKIKSDLRFSEAYKRKEEVEVEGTKIYYLGYYDLIEDKEKTAREKDLEDIRQLKKTRQ